MGPLIQKTSRCAVIGHGSWATAITKVLIMNESSVCWYVRNQEVLESLRTEGRNCRYLSDVEFDMSRIHLTDDVNETVEWADIIFLVTPAPYLKCYLSDLKTPLKDKMVVSAIKGIIPKDNLFVTDYLKQNYGLTDAQLCCISGPTHAEEVSHGRLTYMTFACSNIGNARVIGEKHELSGAFFGAEKHLFRHGGHGDGLGLWRQLHRSVGLQLHQGDVFLAVAAKRQRPNQVQPVQFLWRPIGVLLFEPQPQPSAGRVDRSWQHSEDRPQRDDHGSRGLLFLGDVAFPARGATPSASHCRESLSSATSGHVRPQGHERP